MKNTWELSPREKQSHISPHNGYVLIMGYLGIVGLLLFGMLNAFWIVRIHKTRLVVNRSGNSQDSDVVLWVFVCYCILLFGALFTPVFGTPYMMAVFCFIFGMGIRISGDFLEKYSELDPSQTTIQQDRVSP